MKYIDIACRCLAAALRATRESFGSSAEQDCLREFMIEFPHCKDAFLQIALTHANADPKKPDKDGYWNDIAQRRFEAVHASIECKCPPRRHARRSIGGTGDFK